MGIDLFCVPGEWCLKEYKVSKKDGSIKLDGFILKYFAKKWNYRVHKSTCSNILYACFFRYIFNLKGRVPEREGLGSSPPKCP